MVFVTIGAMRQTFKYRTHGHTQGIAGPLTPQSIGRISDFARLGGPEVMEFIIAHSDIEGEEVGEASVGPEWSGALEAVLEWGAWRLHGPASNRDLILIELAIVDVLAVISEIGCGVDDQIEGLRVLLGAIADQLVQRMKDLSFFAVA
jgi:hypothetical protein